MGGVDPDGSWGHRVRLLNVPLQIPPHPLPGSSCLQTARGGQAAVAKRIREICETRVRYGYRRVHALLDREGWGVNVKKVYRIYKELWMHLRHKTPKRRVKAKLRDDRAEAVGPNDVWAMDFVHDQLATGKKLRVLTVVGTFWRYVPVLDVQLQLPRRRRGGYA